MNTQNPQLSIVIPVFNEKGNLSPLINEIQEALAGRLRFEVVIIDDSSTDDTACEIGALASSHSFVRYGTHETNSGQSAAIHTGVLSSVAPVIAVVDGDGQNDPADIPRLFAMLSIQEDINMVVGERRQRRDSVLRLLSSRIANKVRAGLLDDGIRDTGCGLKVFYRKDFLKLPVFDHMHRFLPALIQREGGKVRSTPVNHRPRTRGISKYGIRNRLFAGIVDMLGVMWLQRRRL